jgi:glucan phosphoethanolaminetransferase (alkaline phosphatase superfamily)
MGSSGLFPLLGLIMMALAFYRIYMLMRVDSARSKNVMLRFFIGFYGLSAFFPLTNKWKNKEERVRLRKANICLALFWLLFLAILLSAIFQQKNYGYGG